MKRYHPTWNLGILEPELLLLLVPDSVVPILRGCVPILRYDSVMQLKDERIKARPRPSPNSGVTVGLLSGAVQPEKASRPLVEFPGLPCWTESFVSMLSLLGSVRCCLGKRVGDFAVTIGVECGRGDAAGMRAVATTVQ